MGVFGCVDIGYGVSVKGRDLFTAYHQDILRQFREDATPDACHCRGYVDAWCPVHAQPTPDIVTRFYRSTSDFSDIIDSILPILTTLPDYDMVGDFAEDIVVTFKPLLYSFNAEGREGTTRSRLLSPVQMTATEDACRESAERLAEELRQKEVPCTIGWHAVSYTL